MRVLFLLTALVGDGAVVNPNTFACEIVRAYVATYGEAAALRWARRHRWSKERIAEARKCLTVEPGR